MTKRLVVEVDDSDLAVVGPRENWDHLIELYESLAISSEDVEEEKAWHRLADWVKGNLIG